MYYYKAVIQYNGTNYCGFQWQKDIPTIQNDFNHCLIQLMSGKITTMGASRTDTGVHAIEQIVKITSENLIECEPFLFSLNMILPPQIRCLSLACCAGSFRPAADSLSKEYRYLFTNSLKSGGVDQMLIANNPYKLDFALMQSCTREIVGRHSFHNFCTAGSNVKTTVRDISLCEISEINPHTVLPHSDLFQLPQDLRSCYQLRIEGNGFLKHMVRHLMSALWLVGGGRISPDDFTLLINGAEKKERLWRVASPRGLYLYRLNYPSLGIPSLFQN